MGNRLRTDVVWEIFRSCSLLECVFNPVSKSAIEEISPGLIQKRVVSTQSLAAVGSLLQCHVSSLESEEECCCRSAGENVLSHPMAMLVLSCLLLVYVAFLCHIYFSQPLGRLVFIRHKQWMKHSSSFFSLIFVSNLQGDVC